MSRLAIPDPEDIEPGLHPREITHYDVIRVRTDLLTGRQTVAPVEHVSISTAEVTAYSPEDPAGNVHRSGPLVIEPKEDHILLESATRQRDARLRDPGAAEIHPHDVSDADRRVVEDVLAEVQGDAQPAEAVDFDAAFRKVEQQRQADLATARATVQDIRRQDQAGVPGTDYDALFAEAEERRQTDLAATRANVQDIRRQDQPGVEGTDYDSLFARAAERQAAEPPGDYPEQPRSQAEIDRFNRDYRRVIGEEPTGNIRQDLRRYGIARSRSGSDGSGGDASRVQSPSGQGTTRSGNRPRSANNSVDVGGLMQGGRNRPRGGGRRRRDADDEDENYRRPTIEIVLEG